MALKFGTFSVYVWRKDKVFDLWGTGLEKEYDLCTFGFACYREEHVVSLYISLAFSLKKTSKCLDLPFFQNNLLRNKYGLLGSYFKRSPLNFI